MKKIFLGLLCCLALATPAFGENVDINGTYNGFTREKYTQTRDGERMYPSYFGESTTEIPFTWKINYDGNNLVITQSDNLSQSSQVLSITKYKYENNILQFITESFTQGQFYKDRYDLKFDGDTAEGTRKWSISRYKNNDDMISVEEIKITKIPEESIEQDEEEKPFSPDETWKMPGQSGDKQGK